MDPDTRTFLGYCLTGLAIVAAVVTIVVTIGIVANSNSHRDGQNMQQCITAGGSWVDRNCILGRTK